MRKYSAVWILILMVLLIIILVACSNASMENEQSKNTNAVNKSQDENDNDNDNDNKTNDISNISTDAINNNESKYLDLSSDMYIADIGLDDDRGSLLKEYGEPQEVDNDDAQFISITYDFAEIICRKDNDKPETLESIISVSSNKLGIEGPRGLRIGDSINLISQSFGFEKEIDFSITGKSIYIYNEQKPDGNFFCRVDYSDKPNEGIIMICAYDIYALRINYKDGKITEMEVFEQQ